MTKQEEIREGMLTPLIKQYLTGKRLTVIDYNRIVDEQQDCLHSQGVVIKVDRELCKSCMKCLRRIEEGSCSGVTVGYEHLVCRDEEGPQYVNSIILIDEDGASRQEVNVTRDPDGVY